MPRTGRPKAPLELTEQEREQLNRWARRRKSAQALASRSRIVLGCADGLNNKEVAVRERVSTVTVGKWRSRFVEARLDGLGDDPRPGRPPTVTGKQVEDVVVETLESTPTNATHWSRAKMAERSGLSPSTIGRIWKAFELKPHRAEGFKLSNDPLFVDKVYDIVGLYLDPPEAAVVYCVDEKSRGASPGPVPAGLPHDARHAGEADPRLRPARHHEPVRGVQHRRRVGDLQPAPPPPHRGVQEVPGQDRRAGPRPPRRPPGLQQLRHPQDPGSTRLARQAPRFTVHFTPTYSSWINQVERFFAYVTADLLQRSDYRSAQALEADIRAWITNWNANPQPFIWTKTADQISSPSHDFSNELTAGDTSVA